MKTIHIGIDLAIEKDETVVMMVKQTSNGLEVIPIDKKFHAPILHILYFQQEEKKQEEYERQKPMNIYALEGHKIKLFVVGEGKIGEVQNGSEQDKIKILKYLKLNKEYTVERTLIQKWTTEVYLKEVPNIYFNSVCFKDITNQSEEDNKKHSQWGEFGRR